MKTMPALTTNVEFGAWADSGKVVFGYPENAEGIFSQFSYRYYN